MAFWFIKMILIFIKKKLIINEFPWFISHLALYLRNIPSKSLLSTIYIKISLLLNTFKKLVCARWPSLGEYGASVKQESMEVRVISGTYQASALFDLRICSCQHCSTENDECAYATVYVLLQGTILDIITFSYKSHRSWSYNSDIFIEQWSIKSTSTNKRKKTRPERGLLFTTIWCLFSGSRVFRLKAHPTDVVKPCR